MNIPLPNWVNRNPEKYRERLIREMNDMKRAFPRFEFKMRGSELLVEGPAVTLSRNMYHVRLYYPLSYPQAQIVTCVMDRDIVEFCSASGIHGSHNLGRHADGGIILCIFGPGEWESTFSAITALNLACVWLHAIEVRKETGIWTYPEYK